MYNTQQIILVYPKCEIMYVTCFGHFSIALALRSITWREQSRKKKQNAYTKRKANKFKSYTFTRAIEKSLILILYVYSKNYQFDSTILSYFVCKNNIFAECTICSHSL